MTGVYRLRRYVDRDFLPGFRTSLVKVTTPRGYKPVGPRFLDERAACSWVHAQGWRHVGPCYRSRAKKV